MHGQAKLQPRFASIRPIYLTHSSSWSELKAIFQYLFIYKKPGIPSFSISLDSLVTTQHPLTKIISNCYAFRNCFTTKTSDNMANTKSCLFLSGSLVVSGKTLKQFAASEGVTVDSIHVVTQSSHIGKRFTICFT